MTAAEPVVGHVVVTDEAEALRRLEHDTVIGIDTETSGLSPYTDSIATVQMYGDQTGTLALFHPRGYLSRNLKEFLNRRKVKWLVHNGVSFDIPFLLAAGVQADEEDWYDTLVGETVVVGSGRRDVSVSLRSAIKRRLDIDLDKTLATSHWMADDLSPEQIRYATSDVVHLPALWRSQLERAEESKQSGALQFEMDLVPVFARMTFNGMPLNLDKLQDYLDRQERELVELKPKFEAEFGDINPNSWQQVAKVFAARHIDIPNTKKETMIDLAQHGGEPGRLAELLLAYRKPAQRLKMYNSAWIRDHVVYGRAHPRFWQCSADTTRVTSSGPNLQQVPRDMREPWGWEDGVAVVASDYSQIEVRIAAEKARDETLMRLLEHEDAHTAIAAEVNQCDISQVTKDMRKAAKAQTFTLLFGGGPGTLYQYAKMQGSAMSLSEAEQMVARFFDTFKGLNAFRNWAEHLANTRRFVPIPLPAGHRRYLRGSQVRPTVILNTIVQGTAANGIKYAMLECKRRGLTKYLAIQVHDELVAAVPEAEAKDYAAELQEAMVVGMHNVLASTVKVETRVSPTWGDAVPDGYAKSVVTTPGGSIATVTKGE